MVLTSFNVSIIQMLMNVPASLSLGAVRNLRDWNGSAEELAERASKLLGEGPTSDVNERLVRDYVSRRILRKPEREGRGAVFHFHQLLQLLAARILLKEEGWPLSKISELIGLAAPNELMRILERHAHTNDAVAVARSLASESGMSSHLAAPAVAPDRVLSSAPPRQSSPTALAAQKLGWREEFRRVRRSLGASTDELKITEVTRVEIAPGLRVEIENERLRRMTEEDARAIGRAVTMALVETAVPRGGKK